MCLIVWLCPTPPPPFPKFLEGATIEVDQIHTHMRPLLMMLGDYRSLTLNVVNRLTSVTRLFPNSFNDKFCDQMMVSYWHITRHYSSLSLLVLSGIYSEMSRRSYYTCVTFRLCFSQQHLRKWMEVVVLTHKGGQRSDGSVSASGLPFACIRLQQGWVSLLLRVSADSWCLYGDLHIFPNADIPLCDFLLGLKPLQSVL